MASLDVSQIIVNSKDFLHAEWASYKQTGLVKSCPLCPYAIGGPEDIPAGCTESVSSGFKELEKALKEVIDLSVDKSTPATTDDIMLSSDGRIFLFPVRKAGSQANSLVPNGEVSAPPPPPPAPGKKSKVPQTPEYLFMNCAEQVSTYMLDHLKRVGEVCLLSGNIKVLCYVVSSSLLIKSRVATYKQVLRCSTQTFPTVMSRCTEMIEVMTQHILNYHCDVMRSCVLHDSPANDWSFHREYEENQGVSLCIQMWAYYMQGIFIDLWNSTSHKVGTVMFANILSDTLSLLVRRYLDNKPSYARLSQMKADTIYIFYVVSSFIFALVSSPRFLFIGNVQNSLVYRIHRRMDFLLRIASIKCSPLRAVAKAFSGGIPKLMHSDFSSNSALQYKSCPKWLSFFNPEIFPIGTDRISSLPDTLALFLILNNAALKPSPDHGLMLRGLLMRNMAACKVILRHLKEVKFVIEKGSVCNGALCYGDRCYSHLSPHSVYAAIAYIINDRCGSKDLLESVTQVHISKSLNFDFLDSRQVWNKQIPPWHHAFISLIIPSLVPVIAEVLKSIPPEQPAQAAHPSKFSSRLENHISAWVRLIFSGTCEVVDMIPLSLIQVSQSLTAVLSPNIKPLGNNVITQLVVSAVYSIVNDRSTLDQLNTAGPVSDSQWDMMIILGERLCSLHEGSYNEDLQRLSHALVKRLEEPEQSGDLIDDYTNEEVLEEICQQMADEVMSAVQGQHAFVVIWEFLRRNMRWLNWVLKVPDLLPSTQPSADAEIEPPLCWGPVAQHANPLVFYNQVLYNKLNHRDLVNFEADWLSVLGEDLWIPATLVRDLIEARPEFEPGIVLGPAVESDVKLLKNVM